MNNITLTQSYPVSVNTREEKRTISQPKLSFLGNSQTDKVSFGNASENSSGVEKKSNGFFQKIFQKPSPEASLRLANELNDKARLNFQKGNYDNDNKALNEAEKLSRESLKLYKRSNGTDYEVGKAKNLLGLIRYKQGAEDEAVKLIKESISIFGDILGPKYQDLQVFNKKLDPDYIKPAVDDKVLRPVCENMGSAIYNLAKITHIQGRRFMHGKMEEAKPIYERAAYILDKTVGSNEVTKNLHENLKILKEDIPTKNKFLDDNPMPVWGPEDEMLTHEWDKLLK